MIHTTGDYIYASLVAFAFLVWIVAFVLIVDKVYRRRKWRKRDEERYAYKQFVGGTDLSATGRAEASDIR